VVCTPDVASLSNVDGEQGHEADGGQPASQAGSRIIVWSWATTAVFAAVALPFAFGVKAIEGVAIGVSLALFAASLFIWVYAFGLAVVRSSRGDDISVPALFFLSSGAAPVGVRRHLLGSLTVACVIAVGTVKTDPFSALVPMLSLGLAGMWAARHGTFPPRPIARTNTVPIDIRSSQAQARASRRSDGRPGQ
jgi:hypothetical protein